MPQFDYVDRYACVCGTRFSGTEAIRSKAEAWGIVTFRQCLSCSSWCQCPRIAESSLSRWYDSNAYQGSANRGGSGYGDYLGDERHRVVEAAGRFRRDIAPWMPVAGGRLLEVGCATGSLLAVARDAGHEVVGIDASARFARAAREFHQLDVIVGDAATVELGDRPFDLVVLLGTVSNIPDLPAVLARLRGVLRPHGTLVFNMPAADSWVARAYGARHWMFTASVVTFMTRAGCEAAVRRAGFELAACAVDQQLPSASKLLHHTKVARILPGRILVPLGSWRSPFRLPIPGVFLIRAVTASRTPSETP